MYIVCINDNIIIIIIIIRRPDFAEDAVAGGPEAVRVSEDVASPRGHANILYCVIDCIMLYHGMF